MGCSPFFKVEHYYFALQKFLLVFHCIWSSEANKPKEPCVHYYLHFIYDFKLSPIKLTVGMLLNTPGNSNHLKYSDGSSWKIFQKTILSHQKITSWALFHRRNCLNHTDLKLSISNRCLVFSMKLLKSFRSLLNKRTARLKPTKQGEREKKLLKVDHWKEKISVWHNQYQCTAD